MVYKSWYIFRRCEYICKVINSTMLLN
jgi:hypothetical protein